MKMAILRIIMLTILFCPLAHAEVDVVRRQYELVFSNEPINEAVHKDIWRNLKKSNPETQKLAKWMMDRQRAYLDYTLESWNCALLSYRDRKIRKTKSYEKTLALLKKQNDNFPFKSEEYQKMLQEVTEGDIYESAQRENEQLLMAASNHSVYIMAGTEVGLNEEVIKHAINLYHEKIKRLEILADKEYYSR